MVKCKSRLQTFLTKLLFLSITVLPFVLILILTKVFNDNRAAIFVSFITYILVFLDVKSNGDIYSSRIMCCNRILIIVSQFAIYFALVLGPVFLIGILVKNSGLSDFFIIATIIFCGYYRLILNSILRKEDNFSDRRLYIYLFVLIFISIDYFTKVINEEDSYLQSSFWIVLLVENAIELLRSKLSTMKVYNKV